MQKRRITSFAIFLTLMTLLLAFQNCGQDPVKGTDTGNPRAPDRYRMTGSGKLADAICQKIGSCDPGSDGEVCYVSVTTQNDLSLSFGVPGSPTWRTLTSTADAEVNGLLGYDLTNLNQCLSDLDALSCAAPGVQGAYLPGNPTPYAGVSAMVPAAGACPAVF